MRCGLVCVGLEWALDWTGIKLDGIGLDWIGTGVGTEYDERSRIRIGMNLSEAYAGGLGHDGREVRGVARETQLQRRDAPPLAHFERRTRLRDAQCI